MRSCMHRQNNRPAREVTCTGTSTALQARAPRHHTLGMTHQTARNRLISGLVLMVAALAATSVAAQDSQEAHTRKMNEIGRLGAEAARADAERAAEEAAANASRSSTFSQVSGYMAVAWWTNDAGLVDFNFNDVAMPTSAMADYGALRDCPSTAPDCEIAMRFTTGQVVAVARGTDSGVALGLETDREAAIARAMRNCQTSLPPPCTIVAVVQAGSGFVED
ncbi:DUF4189 domain-containing protein [Brevundimonas sp.]